MKKYLRYLGPVLITALFVLAIYLLYHKLKAYSIAQIRESIQQVSTGSICFSIGLMIVNYIILVGYDWLALKAIHKSLPLPRVGLVSLVGQAVSYNFGALLGGTSVRYRFYSAWGFSLVEIVRLVLMLAVTFWVGALGLCGVVFLLAPPVIPDELLAKMPIHDVRFLGGILLAIALSYLVLCFTIRKPVHIFGKEFVFPIPRIAVAQMVVAGVDLIAAAACMYVLLPDDLGIGFIDFLPSYLMAQVAVVLTHVPGGVGVFELVILHLTHTPREQARFCSRAAVPPDLFHPAAAGRRGPAGRVRSPAKPQYPAGSGALAFGTFPFHRGLHHLRGRLHPAGLRHAADPARRGGAA